jgi:hypothetical protein
MGMIIISCPSTGHPVPTGIGADKMSFESSSFTGNSVTCVACGQQHTWSKDDAWLAGDDD